MNLLKDLKKKGIKGMFLKIPTRKTPRQIDHQIRREFDRGRSIRVLRRIQLFLDGLEAHPEEVDKTTLSVLSAEVNGLITHLSSYKK